MPASNCGLQRVAVSPELAEKWLREAWPGRMLSEPQVALMASVMLARRWRDDPLHPLLFDAEENRLVTGRRRLAAVIRAGVTVRMYVATGMPPGSIDAGKEGRHAG